MRQPYRIESLTLKEIGVFEHTHFDFPQIRSEEKDAEKAEIHIFTGPNGCGKSTVLYALAAVMNPDPNGGDALVRKRYRDLDSQINFCFMGLEGEVGVGQVKSSGRSLWNNDNYHYVVDGGTNSCLYINRPYLNSSESFSSKSFEFAAFAYSGNRSRQSDFTLSAIQNVTASPFEQALSFEQTVRQKVLAQWIANNRTQAALARAEYEKSEADDYDLALLRITNFIKDICNLDIRFQLKRNPLEVVINIDGLKVTFDALPEGLKSIITWIADLALRLEAIPWKEQRDIFSQPIILLLDEVDIHLHPKWQRRILPAIQKLLPNAQVFVSTHSPFVVGSVEDAYVYRLPEPTKDVCRDPYIPESIPAVPSAAGKSYQLILSEIFDVAEEFDVETEQQLARFKVLKTAYLKAPEDDTELMSLAQTLSAKGEELATLVSLELRQVARLLKNNQG